MYIHACMSKNAQRGSGIFGKGYHSTDRVICLYMRKVFENNFVFFMRHFMNFFKDHIVRNSSLPLAGLPQRSYVVF